MVCLETWLVYAHACKSCTKLTSPWKPWRKRQFQWLAMKKNVYLPLFFSSLAKTSLFGTIPMKSTKNEPRYISSFNVYPGCFPVLRTGYLNHIFPQLSSWSYTPLALFPKGANLMSCPSLLSWFTTLQATAERAPTVGEGTKKKTQQKIGSQQTSLRKKKSSKHSFAVFDVFF